MALNERTVVITGATGGLGRVVAGQMAGLRARLALVSSGLDEVEALGRELGLPPERWLAYAADLTQPESGQAVLAAAMQKFGRVDILLNLVGGWSGGKTVPEVAVDEVSGMLAQHLWSTFYLAQAFVPHLVANGWGRMVIVSSPSAGAPPAKSAAYSVGKAAQEALMMTIAEEVKGTGVTANVIRVKTIDAEHQRERQPSPKNAAWTTPEEISAAIIFLCSDEANMVNGARLPVYGSP